MRTIPDAVLDRIVEHRPHLAAMAANLRAAPALAPQLEKAIAQAYLAGETHLSALDTWYLSQVYYGGPWGGDWLPLARVETDYDPAHLRRLCESGRLPALKYGKTWYIRRDSVPAKA